jgi:nucleotide-binding universal stress UspA family protein
MKILLAADESPFTMKALKFLAAHEGLAGSSGDLLVLNVQPPMPHGVTGMVGSRVVADYQNEEAEKALAPLREFLGGLSIPFRCVWVVGHPVDEILRTAKAEKVDLVAMGTHGHGSFAGMVMGSVSQRVTAACEVPVLLVK